MSDIQLYLLEKDHRSAEAQAIARTTASPEDIELESKQLKLVDLIQNLGEYLNSQDASTRSRSTSWTHDGQGSQLMESAMAYLADVLTLLPQKTLSRQQRDLLNDFILDRIANGADALGNGARGLSALERLGQFDGDRVLRVVDTLLDNASPLVHCKQQRERFEVLTLLSVVFEKYRKEALRQRQEESDGFVPRLIAFFDGEKDPRNLMIVFSIWHVPMVEWDVSNNAQELFEAVFNYFPITFRPPPDDPYGITAQQLKDRLKDCLASTSYFAPHAFPALLDKLDSTSVNVKRDALQALATCAQNYGPKTVDTYSITLWDAVKFEVLSVQEEDLAEEALTVLQVVARTLSSSTHDGPLQSYLRPVAKECNDHLEDTPTKQSSASGRILSTIAKASPEASNLLIRAVLPRIFALHRSAENLPKRRGLLEVLIALINSNVEVFGHWRKVITSEDSTSVSAAPPPTLKETFNEYDEFSDQCVHLLSGALTNTPGEEVSFRLLALEGLRGLGVIRNLLSDGNIVSIVRSLVDIVIKESSYGQDEVKAACIDALVQLAHQKPQLLIESALPALMVQLPDTDVDLLDKTYVLALESLAKLSAEQQIFNTIMIRLKNKLYAALRHGASSAYVLSLLQAMLYCLLQGAVDLQSPTIFGTYYQDLVIPLLKDVVAAGDAQLARTAAARDIKVLDAIGRICNIVVRAQPWVSQTELSRNTYTIFRETSIEALPPFVRSDDPNDTAHTMIVSTHLLASLHRQAKPYTNIASLFSALLDYSLDAHTQPSARQAATSQLALITNKYLKPSDCPSLVLPLFDASSPTRLLSDNTNAASLHVAFTLLQAIVLRTDPLVSEILPAVLTSLESPVYGQQCAQAFASLLSDSELDTLNKENHCIIYSLRKQRFFSLAIPLLIEAYGKIHVDNERRNNYLTALTGTLQHVPYTLIQPSLPDLIPLLLQALSSFSTAVDPTEQATTATALSLFSNIIVHDPKLVESHASSLIRRLLDVSYPTSSVASLKEPPSQKTVQSRIITHASTSEIAARVRSAALTCLTSFVSASGTTTEDGGITSTVIKRELLIPHQKEVVRKLSVGACDDSRRAVRSAAVRCRAVWLALEGGDED
ncbi:MAG: hypothetical protein M1828_005588 [Chrysothrix sp. TS-e1954]|nr:MAG: hypothetical protein M1828_005588 [Chrysothrix sp. TS-e1954]